MSKRHATGSTGAAPQYPAVYTETADEYQANEALSRFVAYSSQYLFWVSVICLTGMIAILQ